MNSEFSFKLSPKSDRILSMLSTAGNVPKDDVISWALIYLLSHLCEDQGVSRDGVVSSALTIYFANFCEENHFDIESSLDAGRFISTSDNIDKPTGS